MSVRTYLGFVADFPTERGRDDAPAGKELADFVAAYLKSAGIDIDGPNERQGWAWDINSQIGGTRIATIIGLVDDMETRPPRQWLITNDSELNIWQRLFAPRKARAMRINSLRMFCETLHRGLVSDSRFSHVVWYNKDTFDRPGDVPGTTP